MKRIQALIVCASMALLTACGTSAVLQAGAETPAADETVVVLGIKPAHYKVLFFPGSEEQGKFVKSSWSNAVINGIPTDGYLIAKVKSEQLIGLTMIADTRAGAFAKPYAPCNGSKALVLKVPQASVVYLGDIEYTPSGAQVGVQYRDDIAAATRYLRTHYPNVTGEVRRAETRAMPVSNACINPAIYVPIYILGGRR